MTHTPLHDNVLVLPDPVSDKTAGGLLVSEGALPPPNKGKVVAVGPGPSVNNMPMQAKVGDMVVYHVGAGFDLVLDGQTYRHMHESEILVIL